MKISRIFILSLCILIVMICLMSYNFNKNLWLDEMNLLLEPSVYLQYEVPGEVREVYCLTHNVQGTFNRKKVLEIAGYLNQISFVRTSHDGSTTKSPNARIVFRDKNEEMYCEFRIYGTSLLENYETGEFFRSRKDNLIEGLEAILTKP